MYHENMFRLLFILVVSSLSTLQSKLPEFDGVICNVQMFQTSMGPVVSRYFCTPSAFCNETTHRLPVMPFDACGSYFVPPTGDSLKCCHQSDVVFDISDTWAQSNRYLPGLRSYLMCKNHSHALCGFDNKSYCYKDNPDSETKGIPTAIDKYPHTALIGYRKEDEMWNWFCMGSIINKRHILTSTYCLKDVLKGSTHVKVGESRICPECPDKLEEQVLEIDRREIASGHGLQQVALIVLKEDIVYNRNVRPACLAAQQPTRQSQGWFARYGKAESLVKTKERHVPVMFFPKDESLVTFKVKTSTEAHILLSENGRPYAGGQSLKVILGMDSNTRSGIRRNKHKTDVETPKLVDQDFRGFWIKYQEGYISVGREDQATPFMKLEDSNPFKLSVVGVSTPKGTGEWIFPDHLALFSLHDLELEVLYTEDCKVHYPNITTKDTYQQSTGDTHSIDDIVFCAGNIHTGNGPCDHDWGGTIQVVDETLYCMWQIFGVYGVHAKDYPRQCSASNPPAIFTNMANLLVWAEHFAFQDFSLYDINVMPPICSFTQALRGQRGRC